MIILLVLDCSCRTVRHHLAACIRPQNPTPPQIIHLVPPALLLTLFLESSLSENHKPKLHLENLSLAPSHPLHFCTAMIFDHCKSPSNILNIRETTNRDLNALLVFCDGIRKLYVRILIATILLPGLPTVPKSTFSITNPGHRNVGGYVKPAVSQQNHLVCNRQGSDLCVRLFR